MHLVAINSRLPPEMRTEYLSFPYLTTNGGEIENSILFISTFSILSDERIDFTMLLLFLCVSVYMISRQIIHLPAF